MSQNIFLDEYIMKQVLSHKVAWFISLLVLLMLSAQVSALNESAIYVAANGNDSSGFKQSPTKSGSL